MADKPTGGSGGMGKDMAAGAAKGAARSAMGEKGEKAAQAAETVKAGVEVGKAAAAGYAKGNVAGAVGSGALAAAKNSKAIKNGIAGGALNKLSPKGGDDAGSDTSAPAPAPDAGGDDPKGSHDALDPAGTGGASSASGDKSDAGGLDGGTSGDGDKGSGLAKGAGALAAVPAAAGVGQLMVIMAFLNWMKGMAMAIAAMVSNFLSAILGAVVAAAKAVAGFFMGIGAAVSSAVGGAVSAVAGAAVTGVATLAVGALAVGSLLTGGGGDMERSQRDSVLMNDCTIQAAAELEKVDMPTDNSQTIVDNAKKIFSVFSAWGMSDENVAGIMGNWDAESRIDPTGVETIYDEPFRLGPRKKAAEAASFDVNAVNAAYGQRFPGVKVVGAGLGQWSNGRNGNLLKYAKKHNRDWYELETQMGFMISADEGADAAVVKDMISTSQGTPAAAAIWFHSKWERSADTSTGHREEMADKWMGMMGGWEANQELADSILEQAETTLGDADANRAEAIKGGCIAVGEGAPVLSDGGLDAPEAQKIIDLYLQEGDSFLKGRYGAGGPGSCGNDKAMNCVSFSTYFVNKYTSFQQYAPGNGIKTASSMASMMGKTTSNTPTPYSVASGPGSGPAGHTFIVMAVNGDVVLGAEAGYCSTRGRLREMNISELQGWEYTDITDIMLAEEDIYTS